MQELHELLREWNIACSESDMWCKQYRNCPTDSTGEMYARSLQRMRAAMDAIVAHQRRRSATYLPTW